MNGRQGRALAVEIALHFGVRSIIVSIAGCVLLAVSGRILSSSGMLSSAA
ncbi:MAG: hypothetical protein IT379_31265 [Deltaproteobacteria bacterium]|nr:hypothetical protein [Deltaproteobacteria bacterium]